ncbi:hypothetical protein F4823DRAFT_169936 [Ustulina deusta]|nr:hypothetical protein F4823DRAFT_169936 [Ustulina deusta]
MSLRALMPALWLVSGDPCILEERLACTNSFFLDGTACCSMESMCNYFLMPNKTRSRYNIGLNLGVWIFDHLFFPASSVRASLFPKLVCCRSASAD